jgi:hypothetical protein
MPPIHFIHYILPLHFVPRLLEFSSIVSIRTFSMRKWEPFVYPVKDLGDFKLKIASKHPCLDHGFFFISFISLNPTIGSFSLLFE